MAQNRTMQQKNLKLRRETSKAIREAANIHSIASPSREKSVTWNTYVGEMGYKKMWWLH